MCKKKHTYADLVIIQNYIMGKIDIVEPLIPHYDMNGDGKVTALDYVLMRKELERSKNNATDN